MIYCCSVKKPSRFAEPQAELVCRGILAGTSCMGCSLQPVMCTMRKASTTPAAELRASLKHDKLPEGLPEASHGQQPQSLRAGRLLFGVLHDPEVFWQLGLLKMARIWEVIRKLIALEVSPQLGRQRGACLLCHAYHRLQTATKCIREHRKV